MAGDLFLKIDSVTENLIFKGTAQCYQTTLIYHAIGEIYDLPIKMVVAPPFTNEEYHSFARWDPDGKHDASNQDNPINQGDFNWDNESKDFIKYGFQQNGFPQNVDDEYFIREFYVPKKTLEERIYLKNMNEKTLSKEALEIIDSYLNFKIDEMSCGIPYYNNKKTGSRISTRVQKGKGSPEEIKQEVIVLNIEIKDKIIIIKEIEVEPYPFDKEWRYLYKQGSPNGNDFSLTTRYNGNFDKFFKIRSELIESIIPFSKA